MEKYEKDALMDNFVEFEKLLKKNPTPDFRTYSADDQILLSATLNMYLGWVLDQDKLDHERLAYALWFLNQVDPTHPQLGEIMRDLEVVTFPNNSMVLLERVYRAYQY